MIDYEKLAAALGLEVDGLFYGGKFKLDPREYAEGEWGIEYYGDNAGWFIPTSTFARLVENGDLLLAHLVEEKVRELLGVRELEYSYNKLGRAKYHRVRIDWDLDAYHRTSYIDFVHEADTKFSAFAAALIWLKERKG